MFNRSKPQSNPGLFTGFAQRMQANRLKAVNDETGWHNLFRQHITTGIDEDLFSVLFSETMGRPNAPLRLIIGMMILKEGHGWSGARLFEESQFNILVMSALGLNNINDEIPSPSTYYAFRKALMEYQMNHGRDLVGECFEAMGKKQMELFGLSGRKLRMDSKLVGSNIVKSSRLHLILSCMLLFYKSLSVERRALLSEEDREWLENLFSRKSVGQILFNLDSEEKSKLLLASGALIYRLIVLYQESDSEKYRFIVRVFEEQYSREEEKIVLRPNEDMKANYLQSPHDEDAEFRNKGGNKTQGYSVNLTETCTSAPEEPSEVENKVVGLNLITHVQVEGATHPDNSFLQTGIEQSAKIVGKVDEVFTDGAFYSPENEKYGQQNDILLYFTGFPGKKGRFGFAQSPRGLEVIDTQTGKIYPAQSVKARKNRKTSQERYKIEFEQEDGTKVVRYFDQQCVDAFFKRQEIENLPAHLKNTRCNVEASIFQLAFGLRKDKTRYRGKFKTQLWATTRCFWVNFRRIATFMGEVCPDHPKYADFVQNLAFLFLTVLFRGASRRKSRSPVIKTTCPGQKSFENRTIFGF